LKSFKKNIAIKEYYSLDSGFNDICWVADYRCR